MTTVTESKSKFSAKGLIIGCSLLFLGIRIMVLVALGVFARSLVVTIEPDEVAVLISPYEPNGYSEKPLTPGKHLIRPLEKVEIFKASREVYLSSSTDCNCGLIDAQSVTFHTKDEAEIIIEYQVIYVINPKQVVKLYRVWEHRYQDEFVIPQSKKFTQDIVSQYTSNEIALTKRDEIEQAIFSRLQADFAEAYLILLEFKIDDVRLNK